MSLESRYLTVFNITSNKTKKCTQTLFNKTNFIPQMSQNFRKTFQLVHKGAVHWFPGHMTKGLRQMQQKLKGVDCIIEVHDARIPFSGRNSEFKHTISGLKPHILVLNKKDLADTNLFAQVTDKIRNSESIDHVIYTNCKNEKCSGINRIIPKAAELITNSDRFNRADEKSFCIMVVGVPNVGKSSLLNILRSRHLKRSKASAVGAVAGITRSVLNQIKVCEDPLVYMLDTPGILTPNIKDVEVGMKLALCACLQDHLVGEDFIADYLLYWLNKSNNFDYMTLMGLEAPTDSIAQVLLSGARKLNKVKKLKNYDGSIVVRPDLIAAAKYFIKHFRNGYFGNVNLDANDLLDK